MLKLEICSPFTHLLIIHCFAVNKADITSVYAALVSFAFNS